MLFCGDSFLTQADVFRPTEQTLTISTYLERVRVAYIRKTLDSFSNKNSRGLFLFGKLWITALDAYTTCMWLGEQASATAEDETGWLSSSYTCGRAAMVNACI